LTSARHSLAEGTTPLRALQIVTAYPRHEGDVITPWLGETLRGLRGEGIEPEVLAPAYRGGGAREVGGIRVFRYRYALPAGLETLTHDETTPDRLARDPAYALLLPGYVAAGCAAAAALQRRRRYDVVHVHWAVPHGVMGWAARAAGARALVTTFYGSELRWAQNRFRPAETFLKTYCRRGTLIAISGATRGALARYTSRPVHVVPYPASLGPTSRPGERDEARRGRGGRPDRHVPNVLFVGRLVKRKGIANLLRAAVGSRIPYRIVLVGFGPEETALRALASELGLGERVELAGRVSEAELSRRYDEADVFVLPATLDERGDTEGLGVVLLEALTHGVPVVATRRGGIPDIVKNGETGLLVEDGDLAGLGRAIDTLLADPDLGRRLAGAGADHVWRQFSVESVAAKLAGLYRTAIADGDRPVDATGRPGAAPPSAPVEPTRKEILP
jgi:glycosyltransferase involved in cell wall biosynthesis